VDLVIHHTVNIGSTCCFMQRCYIVNKFPHYYFPYILSFLG
jgi:hypothetical protein